MCLKNHCEREKGISGFYVMILNIYKRIIINLVARFEDTSRRYGQYQLVELAGLSKNKFIYFESICY